MKYLFDASALLNLVRRLGGEALKILEENYILTLTIYEVGNALWRETRLSRRLTMDEAEAIMRAIITLIKFMQVIEPQDPIEVLRISNEIETTFYDAAYVVTALRRGLVLVTDDRRLATRIERYRDMIVKEYEEELHVIRSTEL